MSRIGVDKMAHLNLSLEWKYAGLVEIRKGAFQLQELKKILSCEEMLRSEK